MKWIGHSYTVIEEYFLEEKEKPYYSTDEDDLNFHQIDYDMTMEVLTQIVGDCQIA